MGVRCTLLGHDYGDSEIEREREESGDEAVVTIREVRICDRCGDRSVLSENKEVTSAAPPADDGQPESTAEPEPTEPPPATVEEGEAPERDPETDDGVILEDDEDEEPAERQYGEWPDAEDDHGSAEADPRAGVDSQAQDWPDAPGDDEGYDATAPDGEEPDVEYPRTPEDQADLEADSGGGDEPTRPGADSDLQRAGEAPAPTGPPSEATELHCPACGYRDPTRDGSLREGDICPECKQGYLAARN